jgi:hypothetical protein
MIGVFWNCKGVCKKGMVTEIKNLLNDTNTDFIGLQETMQKRYQTNFSEILILPGILPGIGCPHMADLGGSSVG